MEAAATKCWISRRVRKIADALVNIEGRGGCRPAVHPRKIERPSPLLQPWSDVDLELGPILLGNTPSRDVGTE